MLFPTIHLNGTDPQVLLKKLEEAAMAINTAMEALQAAAPHGRDYYPQGDDVFFVAQREHIERQASLEKVSRDVEKLAWHVQDQIDVKKGRL